MNIRLLPDCEVLRMAGKRRDPNGDPIKAPAKDKAPRFNNARFVNRELSTEEGQALKALPYWSEDWDTYLLRANDSGYKVTLKYDEWSKSYAAFMTTDDEFSPNFQMILTGRGSCPLKALRQVLYKHYVLAAEEQWVSLDRQFAQEIDD